MQISRQTIAEWLDGRDSAEFCHDQHGFYSHTLDVDKEKHTISMTSRYSDPLEIPPMVSIPRIDPRMKVSELAQQFCRARGDKMKPTGMYVWGAGVWIH
jgi:hypothetical protein